MWLGNVLWKLEMPNPWIAGEALNGHFLRRFSMALFQYLSGASIIFFFAEINIDVTRGHKMFFLALQNT